MEIFDLMNLLLSFFITIITVIVVFYVKTEVSVQKRIW